MQNNCSKKLLKTHFNGPLCAGISIQIQHFLFSKELLLLPISGRVDGASATETVDLGLIPGRVKPKTI